MVLMLKMVRLLKLSMELLRLMLLLLQLTLMRQLWLLVELIFSLVRTRLLLRLQLKTVKQLLNTQLL
ncbi:MAG: hypothetical protein EBT75_09585 [Proteobacteria bacterium]|nr:hypothetical protein [Pseudomonadota bacterium]